MRGATASSRSLSPVLLADGCSFSRRQARSILADLGFRRIHEAADGAEAVGLLGTTAPGLLVLDWNLRVITPGDILEIVRAGSGNDGGTVPVLVTMSEPRRSDVERAMGLGTTSILAKPYSARLLSRHVAQAVGL